MVEEMLGLGFNQIELSHGIRISLVPGILRAVEEGIVKVSSVHNFCPLPNSVQHAAPNYYQPSAYDSRERELWQRYSLQTFAFASKVNAKWVVMHSGSVEFFFWSPEVRLDRWIKKSGLKAQELSSDKGFQKRRDRALKRISGASRPWLERVSEGYASLFDDVRARGLTLGIENREGLEELPLEKAFGDFFQTLGPDAPVGYWHDTGHAQLKHQFGLIDHAAHLEKMGPRLRGFHLHDVSASGKDHQVPGSGTVDFDMIARHIRPEHALVLELSPSLKSEEVVASRDFIAEKLA